MSRKPRVIPSADLELGLDAYHGIRAQGPVNALALAAINSSLREMRLLIADGVDVNGLATFSGETPLCAAAGLGLSRSVSVLLDAGADVNRIGENVKATPLMMACSFGRIRGSRVARQLMAAGADVRYVRPSDGMTALKLAAQSCDPDVLQQLIDGGADPDEPDWADQTALMMAARANHLPAIEVLVNAGANVAARARLRWARGMTAEEIAVLKRKQPAAELLARHRHCLAARSEGAA